MNQEQIVNPNHQPAAINPWIAIVYKPRAAMRQVLDTNPERHIFLIPLLLVLVSVPSTILSANAQLDMVRDAFSESGIEVTQAWVYIYVAVTVPFGYLFYLLHIYALGWIYGLIGERMGGRGTTKELRSACLWTIVPMIYYSVLMTPFSTMFSKMYDPQQFEGGTLDPSVLMQSLLLGLLSLAFMGYMTFIHVSCIAEAHRISWVNAFVVLCLTLVLGLALMVGVGFLAFIVIMAIIMFAAG